MAGSNNDVALRKRQQIDMSKRTMFISVAIVAFVSGVALVVSYFLILQIILHGRVIAEKQKTVSTIAANIETMNDLKDNIRVLDTNEALMSARSSDESSALQVILDALPADSNADALGASLQVHFAGAVNGLTLEKLAIDDVDSTVVDSDEGDSSGNGNDAVQGVGFSMSVSGSAEGLKELLARFEKSIRIIKINSVDIIAVGEGRLTMDIAGVAYYQQGTVMQLEDKVVKP